MAIDTETKRRCVSGYSGLIIAPVPDMTITEADRAQVAGIYRIFGGGVVAIIRACAVLIQAIKPLAVLLMQTKPTADVTQRPC